MADVVMLEAVIAKAGVTIIGVRDEPHIATIIKILVVFISNVLQRASRIVDAAMRSMCE
jgi:hypothetical protein